MGSVVVETDVDAHVCGAGMLTTLIFKKRFETSRLFSV
jgi:hypothetical protein